jgi:hypothetical protein
MPSFSWMHLYVYIICPVPLEFLLYYSILPICFFLCFVFSSYEQASHKEFKIACLTVDDSSLGPGDEYVCLIII